MGNSVPDSDDETKEVNTKAIKITSKYSLIHDDLTADNVVFVSLDLETGGKQCGIYQLSAKLSEMTGH